MMNLKVVTSTGTFTARCLPVDFIAFEEHFDKPISVLEQGRLTHLYWLAFASLERTGQVNGAEFKAWAATVVSIEQADEDEIPPLGSSQPTG